jgi:hypothetical protein
LLDACSKKALDAPLHDRCIRQTPPPANPAEDCQTNPSGGSSEADQVTSAILEVSRPFDAAFHSAWIAIPLAEFALREVMQPAPHDYSIENETTAQEQRARPNVENETRLLQTAPEHRFKNHLSQRARALRLR